MHLGTAVRNAAVDGLRKGLKSYVWLLKILLPVSLATALLDHSGWLQRLDFLLAPLMDLMHLPPAAALPILIGLTAGVYGCLAAMAVLPLSAEHLTLISVFVLIAHSLPQEGLIQSRSGIPFAKATFVRLVAAILTCQVVAWLLAPSPLAPVDHGFGAPGVAPPLALFLQQWGAGMIGLCAKILLIILGVMVVIEVMKALDAVPLFLKFFGPVLALMGLHRRTGMLWLTGALFGLAYGGAVIVEQSRELDLNPEEVEKLQLSIGINHSMIEDPLLFLPFVVSPVYAWLPRLAAAVAVAYAVSLGYALKSDRRPPAGA